MSFLAACGSVAAPEVACESAAQCTDPAAPFCIDQRCEASCRSDDQCLDPAAGVCAADGVCVGCEANTDCGADAPICDASTRACRGCARDADCAGGVCIEADGTCAADAEVAFVADAGSDAGRCPRTAPCHSMAYALGNLAGRRVIHVLGGGLIAQSLAVTSSVIIDGEDTTLTNYTGVAFALSSTATSPIDVVVEGFRLTPVNNGPSNPPSPVITATGVVRAKLHGLTIAPANGTVVDVTNAADVVLTGSQIGSASPDDVSWVNCGSARLRVEGNQLGSTTVGNPAGQGSCELTVARNRFESSRDGAVQLYGGGLLVMENNLVVHRIALNDSISVSNLRAGSVIRFNTVVNETAVASDGSALYCDGTIAVTSNIFAYNSAHPITGQGCAPRYSIFDAAALTSAGTGNLAVPLDSIFVARGTDYHLAAKSAARAAAEPGQRMVTIDLEGHARPDPASAGALEP